MPSSDENCTKGSGDFTGTRRLRPEGQGREDASPDCSDRKGVKERDGRRQICCDPQGVARPGIISGVCSNIGTGLQLLERPERREAARSFPGTWIVQTAMFLRVCAELRTVLLF